MELITVALIGNDWNRGGGIEGSLNSVLFQNYSQIELFISMDELSAPVDEIINILNSNRKDNIVSLNLNFPKMCDGTIEHLTYVKNHMKGKWLLCLHNGEALYSTESLSLFADTGFASTINICNCGVFDKNDTYITTGFYVEDGVSSYSCENGCSLIGQCKGYGLVFERKFVQSKYFGVYDFQNDEFLSKIDLYLRKYKENFSICRYPIIKRKVYEHVNKEQQGLSKQQLEIWRNDLANGKIKLNYSRYISIYRLTTKSINNFNKSRLLDEIEKNIFYFNKKNDECLSMSSGDKAYAVYLSEIHDIFGSKFYLRKKHFKKLRDSLLFESRIKVVMVVNERSLWRSCYESVYKLLSKKEKYIVDVVYVPFTHPNKGEDIIKEQIAWTESGVKVYLHSEYDMAVEAPDFLIYCKPYDSAEKRWNIEETRKIVDKIIYIPYSMATMRAGEEIKRLMYKLPLQFWAWKYLSYSKEHLCQLKKYAYNQNNALAIGHPKFDITIDYMTEKEKTICDEILYKANGRKIFFLNTHFDINPDENRVDNAGTFLNIGIKLLKWLEVNEEYFIIWRPHPFFYPALEKALGLEAQTIWEDAKRSTNIYLDEYENQWPAIWLSDAMISDSSGVIETFVITNKPILMTVRKKSSANNIKYLYLADKFEEVVDFIVNIESGKDTMYEQRTGYVQDNYFLPVDTSVAELIVNEMENELKPDVWQKGKRIL